MKKLKMWLLCACTVEDSRQARATSTSTSASADIFKGLLCSSVVLSKDGKLFISTVYKYVREKTVVVMFEVLLDGH